MTDLEKFLKAESVYLRAKEAAETEDDSAFYFRFAKMLHFLTKKYSDPTIPFGFSEIENAYCEFQYMREHHGSDEKAWEKLTDDERYILNAYTPLVLIRPFMTNIIKERAKRINDERKYRGRTVLVNEKTGERYYDGAPKGVRCILDEDVLTPDIEKWQFLSSNVTLTVHGKRINAWKQFTEKYSRCILEMPPRMTYIVNIFFKDTHELRKCFRFDNQTKPKLSNEKQAEIAQNYVVSVLEEDADNYTYEIVL